METRLESRVWQGLRARGPSHRDRAHEGAKWENRHPHKNAAAFFPPYAVSSQPQDTPAWEPKNSASAAFSLSRPHALNHLPQKTSRRTENMSWLRQKLRPVCKPTAHEMVTIFWPRNRSLFYNRYKKNVPFSSPQTGTVFLLLFHKAASFFFTVGIAGFPPGNRCLEAVERRGARSPRGRPATASHQPRRDSGSFFTILCLVACRRSERPSSQLASNHGGAGWCRTWG